MANFVKYFTIILLPAEAASIQTRAASSCRAKHVYPPTDIDRSGTAETLMLRSQRCEQLDDVIFQYVLLYLTSMIKTAISDNMLRLPAMNSTP